MYLGRQSSTWSPARAPTCAHIVRSALAVVLAPGLQGHGQLSILARICCPSPK